VVKMVRLQRVGTGERVAFCVCWRSFLRCAYVRVGCLDVYGNGCLGLGVCGSSQGV